MAVSSTVPVLLDVESNGLALVVALTRHSSAYSLRLCGIAAMTNG